MKQLRTFALFLLITLLLAACSQDTQQPAPTTAPAFSFSVDPASGTATLQDLDAHALEALQTDTCDAGVRTLTPGQELALVHYDYAFLPGNILTITASFQNVTTFTYEQPFTFSQDAQATSNIVSSTEPTVSNTDLGGDGALAPNETTTVLTFTVEHMGQPFTYGVFAEADVNCPTEPQPETGSLRIFKYHDRDESGTHQEMEEFLAGWEFTVYDSRNNEVGKQTTATVDSNIYALFENLPVNESYTVCETMQPN